MRNIYIYFINIDPLIIENIVILLSEKQKITSDIFYTDWPSPPANFKMFDYIIIDPLKCRSLIPEIMEKKKPETEVIVFTVSDNIGETSDSVYKSMGVNKIIRIPSQWEVIRKFIEL